MKVHEYQAKGFFASYGLPVDNSILCFTPDEAVAAYKKLGVERAVVKAQVHTGGRGKAGGVKLAGSEAEVKECAKAILGMNIKGFTVDRVLVGEAVYIAAEYYVSIVIDRKSKTAILMLSREGGMDIEAVAKETPEKIFKIAIDPTIGLADFKAREAALKLFDDMAQVKQAIPLFQKLYQLFVEKDASLAEINPLVKHAFNKPAESHIRIFCLVRIEHRIHGCQFFYMRTCHFVHCHKNRLSASKPRLQPSEHIRFDLISVTAKQRRLILPEFFWLIKQIIAETLFVILNENMPFINIHPYCDSPQHLRQLFRQLRNTEHDPVDLRKRLQRQFDKFSKQPYCFIGFFSKFNFFPCQAFIQ